MLFVPSACFWAVTYVILRGFSFSLPLKISTPDRPRRWRLFSWHFFCSYKMILSGPWKTCGDDSQQRLFGLVALCTTLHGSPRHLRCPSHTLWWSSERDLYVYRSWPKLHAELISVGSLGNPVAPGFHINGVPSVCPEVRKLESIAFRGSMKPQQ